MTTENQEEVEAAKQVLWNMFVTQFIVNWSNKFPRNSPSGHYTRKPMVEWLEEVGKREADRVRREEVNK